MDLTAAAGLLQGLHVAISMARNEPHWLINDADAKRYGAALANALRHLKVEAAQKSIDFSVLVVTAFIIEMPRIGISAEIARQRAAQAKQGFRPQVVYPFPANPNPQPAPPPSGNTPPSTTPPQGSPVEGFTIEGDAADAPNVGP